MDTKKIGKFIAVNRKKKGLTQEQLGERLGVSNKTISRWENGNYMPDLSLLIPISEELDITLNELLNGEEITNDNMMKTTEESLKNTIDYSKDKIEKEHRKISICIMLVGVLLCFASFTILDKESSWCSIYSILGIIIFVYGVFRELKVKRLLVSSGLFIVILSVFMIMDYVGVVADRRPPIYRYMTKTSNIVTYYNPFYNVYRINRDTKNEYYVVDTAKKYTEETVPQTIFNRPLSGIHNIKKYKNPYVGNNANIGNLISCLPLHEYGYAFKIDSKDLGLIINYSTNDWYNEDREDCARKMADMDIDVHPIGGVVPLMEQYRYTELVDVIISSKKGLNPNRPVHLFGAGHPMILAFATLLGCDLFDSASYAKFARDDRFMFIDGTYRIADMQSLD